MSSVAQNHSWAIGQKKGEKHLKTAHIMLIVISMQSLTCSIASAGVGLSLVLVTGVGMGEEVTVEIWVHIVVDTVNGCELSHDVVWRGP